METQGFIVVIVVLALVIVALILALFYTARQNGQNFPTDIKPVLGAVAGLAVLFALKSENKLDDTVVNNILLPMFGGLGIPVQKIEMPTPTPQPTPPTDAIAG